MIKKRLQNATFATVGLIVVMGLLALIGQEELHRLVDQSDRVDKLGKQVFQINILTSDYLLNPSERAKQQWLASHKKLYQLLDSLEKDLTDSLSIGHQRKDSLLLFQRLESLYKEPRGADLESLKTVLVGQLLTRSDTMVSRIQRIEQVLHQEMETQQRLYQWLGFGLLLCSALAAIFLFRQLNQKISQPLQKLKAAANRIGQGDFTARVSLQSNDEFSQLAVAMNAMAENLQETTARKEQLDAEIGQRRASEQKLNEQQQQQQQLIKRLEQVNNQLIQSEKMAAIGQMAAGVAHEINNPAGFVSSNLSSLEKYVTALKSIFDAYEEVIKALPEDQRLRVEELSQQLDIDFIWQDLDDVINESSDGIRRICKIVTGLKDFSHQGQEVMDLYDIRDGLERTLIVVNNELKYKATIICDLQKIPMIECDLQQLNQVFMNLLVNAAYAIVENGQVIIRTATHEKGVLIEIEDTGCGISVDHLDRLFEPFFTTKPIGKGTGLGLSISYGIIQHHHGELSVTSKLGEGSCFRIILPLQQPETSASEPILEDLRIISSDSDPHQNILITGAGDA